MINERTAAELAKMTAEQLDTLPYGVIELDAQGNILNYNAGESELSGRSAEQVIGKNFFTDVAPCTDVQDFHGRFLDLIEHRAVNYEFEFVFTFKPPQTVKITMLYEQQENTVWVMVKKT